MATNSIRFTGLASGLDTDSMVKALMTPQQNKIDKQTGQKTLLDWKKDAWKEMNTKINTFYTKYVDKMRYAGTFNKTATTVSNESAIKLDKNTIVPEGSHTIKVEQMATAAVVNSKTISKDKNNQDVTLTTKLEDLNIADGEKIKLTVGDIDIEVTVGEMIDLGGGITAQVDDIVNLQNAVNIKLKEAKSNPANAGKNIPDLTFKFDTGLKGFIVGTKGTGATQTIKLDNAHASTFTKLGIGGGTLDVDGTTVVGFKDDYTGTNAKVTYNGGIIIESSTNKIEVNGFKFDIMAVTSEPVTISSTKDTEAIVSFVKEFVDAYNTLLDDITTKLSTKKPLDYEPLTSEQKESMTDADIEDWEKKIKDGLFYRDSSLAEVREAMQNILQNSVVGNKYAVLGKIGLASTSWKDQGRITLNEEKLKAAVNEDADAVIELFIGNDTTEGIGTKLNKSFKTMSESIKDVKTYNSYYNDVVDTEKTKAVSERITALQEKYETMEKMYYNKFTAMEKMMSQLNNQSNWLTNALA
jgi:flagellar hook-associated protein 2